MKKKKSAQYSPSRGVFKGRKFQSIQSYRQALARKKGFKSEYRRRLKGVRISSIKDLDKLSLRERDKRTRAIEVLGVMRNGKKNLAQAIREFNRNYPSEKISSQAVRKYAGAAMRKKGSFWQAKPYDRLLRLMRFPTSRGEELIEVRDSRTATKIGEFHSAMGRYLETGDISVFHPFGGKQVVSRRVRYPYITDPDLIERLAEAGEFQFDSIYELMDKK